MAGKPKPSVSFLLPKERLRRCEQHLQLRVNVGYNKKRHSLSLNILNPETELMYLFTSIDKQGNFTPHPTVTGADERGARQLAKQLTDYRDFLLRLINRAVESGTWERLTTNDIRNFMGYEIVQGADAVLCNGGLFDKWASQEGRKQ